MKPAPAKPRLLVVELWGLGDLVIGSHFLRAAARSYDVTLIAKPYAAQLRAQLWPEVTVLPFSAPWAAFRGKYRWWRWPWREMFALRRTVRSLNIDIGLSARWDPRDHWLLSFLGVRRRLGFSRLGSKLFLTEPLVRPPPESHRYENWRTVGAALGLKLPERERIPVVPGNATNAREILVHTGAGQPIRVWPLENYKQLVARLRQRQYTVQVACDPSQRNWWLQNGEAGVATPQSVPELMNLLQGAAALIGNDSGPGHLAAFSSVPTFSVFGAQIPEWFAPLHPAAEWIDGNACPYKPCSDYCRFTQPICITTLTEPQVWAKVEPFLNKVMPPAPSGH